MSGQSRTKAARSAAIPVSRVFFTGVRMGDVAARRCVPRFSGPTDRQLRGGGSARVAGLVDMLTPTRGRCANAIGPTVDL
jgi:hypothetical protein